ncbi:hypothetical protein SNA_20835 [Streptomyces natalensis ATCC 27448]|uniref:Uncharacterized protein n=2 Tax=Streptomyces natalensis TaxID=68242 RepID=A0A0D7CHW7_9ACTN|nr:hypothetical protein SNA_20835 [Streptomyces natalensis ATCC 27448]
MLYCGTSNDTRIAGWKATRPAWWRSIGGRFARRHEEIPEFGGKSVLRMERDTDVEMLLQAVTAAGPDGRIDLTAAQEAAAERFMDCVITAMTAGQLAIERDLQPLARLDGATHPAALVAAATACVAALTLAATLTATLAQGTP